MTSSDPNIGTAVDIHTHTCTYIHTRHTHTGTIKLEVRNERDSLDTWGRS